MHFIKSFVVNYFPRKILKIIMDMHDERKGRKNERHFSGDAVFCPCCLKRFGRFMDFSVVPGHIKERYINTYKNSMCPYCASKARHRIVCHYFDANKQTIPQNDILMFGPEFSIRKWLNRNGFRYQTADLFDRTADLKIDIQNIPFPDESYKLIICNHVLEHVQDYKVALRELKRVLHRDGFLEITVPTDRRLETVYEDPSVKEDDRANHFGQHDHLRLFGNDFENILKEFGFLVEVVDGSTLPAEISGVIGPFIYDDNRVYICRNKLK